MTQMGKIIKNSGVRASFTVEHKDEFVVVVDMSGMGTVAMSVTNDAENVVRFLFHEGVLNPSARLLYRDASGRWDEMRHDGRGAFQGFALLGPKTLADAMRIARENA